MDERSVPGFRRPRAAATKTNSPQSHREGKRQRQKAELTEETEATEVKGGGEYAPFGCRRDDVRRPDSPMEPRAG